MSTYKFILYAALSLTTIATILFFADSPRGILDKLDVESEQDIFAYAVANNASTRYYDDDGSVLYTFKSKRLSHFQPTDKPSDSYTTIEEPNIVIFHEQAPWHITAHEGRIDNQHMITLSDNVELKHHSIDGAVTTLSTSEMVFDPEQKLAHTEEAVTIVSPLGTMTAVGMKADIASHKIKLLSNVKGHHKPENFGQ